MNQMRNSVHILANFMKKNGVIDLKEKLREIGRNIAKTYVRYWKPTVSVNTSNVKDVIATIYQFVFNSTVSIEILDEDNLPPRAFCPRYQQHYHHHCHGYQNRLDAYYNDYPVGHRRGLSAVGRHG